MLLQNFMLLLGFVLKDSSASHHSYFTNTWKQAGDTVPASLSEHPEDIPEESFDQFPFPDRERIQQPSENTREYGFDDTHAGKFESDDDSSHRLFGEQAIYPKDPVVVSIKPHSNMDALVDSSAKSQERSSKHESSDGTSKKSKFYRLQRQRTDSSKGFENNGDINERSEEKSKNERKSKAVKSSSRSRKRKFRNKFIGHEPEKHTEQEQDGGKEEENQRLLEISNQGLEKAIKKNTKKDSKKTQATNKKVSDKNKVEHQQAKPKAEEKDKKEHKKSEHTEIIEDHIGQNVRVEKSQQRKREKSKKATKTSKKQETERKRDKGKGKRKRKGEAVKRIHDCSKVTEDSLGEGFDGRGGIVRLHIPKTKTIVDVYCDVTTGTGGWTVMQRRINGSLAFNKTFTEYENGFGDVRGEHWLGLRYISSLLNGSSHQLRVELVYTNGKKAAATYRSVEVGGSNSRYKLTVGSPYGRAHDFMSPSNNKEFSMCGKRARRNKCTCEEKSGFWFGDCDYNNPNGLYWNSKITGIKWKDGKGKSRLVSRIEMKFRKIEK